MEVIMNRQDIRNQFRVLSDYRRAGYGNVILCACCVAVVQGIRPYIALLLMGRLLDNVYAGAGLSRLFLLTAAALGAEWLCATIFALAIKGYNKKMEYMYEQQNLLIDKKLLDMDYEYLENPKVHGMIHSIRNAGTNRGLIGRVLDDLERTLQAAVSILAAVILTLPLLFTGLSSGQGALNNQDPGRFGAFFRSPLSTLLLLLLIAAMILISYRTDLSFGQRIKRFHEKRTKDENFLDHCMGIFSSPERQKDLRIYQQQKLIREKSEEAIRRVERETCREAGLTSAGEAVKRTISALTGLLVYVFAALRAAYGLITPGEAVTCASSIIRMSSSLAELMSALASSQYNARYCRDYVRFMETGRKRYEGTLPVEKRKDNRFSVEFENVSFRYPGSEEYVIRNLNLKLLIGERIAIVGRNGSGKTTFIKLLCRLYDVTEGCIRLNGVDIRKYDYQEYCRLFSVVFQDFRIFAFPLGEAVAGSENVDEDRARDALAAAGLSEALKRLPQGLHTWVGKEYADEGIAFSGGEKQKMAIARAVYKNAHFVIMDEPTAALDPLSECEVYEGFDRVVSGEGNPGLGNPSDPRRSSEASRPAGKTAFYISHRLASCRFCRNILVFDQGRIVQQGSHEELVEKEGLYRELWNAQAQYYGAAD